MTFDERLDNWARAMRGSNGTGRAHSLEGAYRSPQPWDEPVYSWRAGIDLQDAYRVEAAWSSLPEFPRYILRARYCLAWLAPQICRVVARVTKLPCEQRHFDKHLADSREALAIALERPEPANRSLLRTWVKKVLALADDTAQSFR